MKKNKIKTNKAYKAVLKELRRYNGMSWRETLPTINFMSGDYLHTIYACPRGLMTYLVSKNDEVIDRFEITEAIMNTSYYNGRISVAIKSPIPNLWVFVQIGGQSPQLAKFVTDEFVTDWKRDFSTNIFPDSIAEKVYEMSMKH
jgi:hypothetical protein